MYLVCCIFSLFSVNILSPTKVVYKTAATIAMIIVAQTGKPETVIKPLLLTLYTEKVSVFNISSLFNLKSLTFYMYCFE